MKKEVLRTILVVTIMAFLLAGCSNSGVKAETEEISEVTQEEVKESEVEIEKVRKESKAEEMGEEPEAQEKVTEEQEETSNEMKEAQITTTVADITDVANYIVELNPMLPHIIIWNEVEGYVVDIGEGECYHLKKDDKIYLILPDIVIGHVSSIPELSYENTTLGYNPIPDYSQFESPLEVWYGIQLEGTTAEEIIYTHCYLYPPAE